MKRDLRDTAERERAASELETLLFAASRPLSSATIARRLYVEESGAIELLGWLTEELRRPTRGLRLKETAGQWRLTTKPENEDVLAGIRAERKEKPLTEPALETLAVVALRQPVTTEEITEIRGAESYGTVETLRRHRLIAKAEQRASPGKAARWRTTQRFLERFGLADLQELYREGRLEAVFGPVYSSDGP